MKYCPFCESEYFDDIEICADCRAPLIGAEEMKKIVAEREKETKEIFIKAGVLENQFEADIIKNALEKEGIPVIIRSFHDTAYNGIFIPQKGWGLVLVPAEYRAKAEDLISTLKSTFKNNDEHSIDEPVAQCPQCGENILPGNEICPFCKKPL